MAWDIAVSPPKALYDTATINKAGAIAKQLGITWAGTWKTPDKPHFEINANWKPKEAEMVTQTKIELNGKTKTVSVITKDGNNYIKLRGLEDDKIKIDYNAATKLETVTVK